jgi:hypothetical protein
MVIDTVNLWHWCLLQGCAWLATRHELWADWDQAGPFMCIALGAPWYTSLSNDKWPVDDAMRQEIKKVTLHLQRRREVIVDWPIGRVYCLSHEWVRGLSHVSKCMHAS